MNRIMEYVIGLIIGTIILLAVVNFANAHENKEMKHGSTGSCFGWKIEGGNVRLCYTNENRTRAKRLIYDHGQWHVGPEFDILEAE